MADIKEKKIATEEFMKCKQIVLQLREAKKPEHILGICQTLKELDEKQNKIMIDIGIIPVLCDFILNEKKIQELEFRIIPIKKEEVCLRIMSFVLSTIRFFVTTTEGVDKLSGLLVKKKEIFSAVIKKMYMTNINEILINIYNFIAGISIHNPYLVDDLELLYIIGKKDFTFLEKKNNPFTVHILNCHVNYYKLTATNEEFIGLLIHVKNNVGNYSVTQKKDIHELVEMLATAMDITKHHMVKATLEVLKSF